MNALRINTQERSGKTFDSKHPSIEVEVIQTKSKRGLSLQRFIHVNYRGNRIGRIDMNKVDVWNTHPYSARYYERNGDERGEHAGSFDTLYAAKTGVFTKWKENAKPEKQKYDPAMLPSGDNSDFYPTPSALAGKMMAMVDWKEVRSVLEPSAGKGDLLECMGSATYKRQRYSRNLEDIDCIEMDQNLRYILTGKGYRVVHDDFLTYHTQKRYDLIVMNPPFSDGDRHLEKALEIQQDGGQIVCLLNAETLRNPHTVRRKHLFDRLTKLGARIQFIKGAFLRAERRSDVEVAIVSVHIPMREFDSSIFERMKKATEQTVQADSKHELVGGNFIEQMITNYGVEVAATLEFMREYNGLVPYILTGSQSYAHALLSIKIGDQSYDTIDNEGVNRYMRAVRGKYWDNLFHLPQLTSKFTSDLMKEYQSSVDKMEEYEFSEFNIRQIIGKLDGSLRTGIDKAIMDVFEKMTAAHSWWPETKNNIHYYSGWATNKAHKIGKKVIIPIHGSHSDSWRGEKLAEYTIYGVLGDIEKSLNYLDQGVTAESDMHVVLKTANAAGQTRNIAFKYFNATFFKKGTCHITFHDQRMVDLLNIYAARGRNWLPPNYGKARYEQMTPEEREVVDSFQGKEQYERIMENADYYLVAHNQQLLLGVGQM